MKYRKKKNCYVKNLYKKKCTRRRRYNRTKRRIEKKRQSTSRNDLTYSSLLVLDRGSLANWDQWLFSFANEKARILIYTYIQ